MSKLSKFRPKFLRVLEIHDHSETQSSESEGDTFNFWRNKLTCSTASKSRTNDSLDRRVATAHSCLDEPSCNRVVPIPESVEERKRLQQSPLPSPPQVLDLNTQNPIVILRLKTVMARTGLSRSSIYDRLDSGSKRHDRSFPAQVRLGAHGRAVGWLSNEIDSWLLSQVTFSRGACH